MWVDGIFPCMYACVQCAGLQGLQQAVPRGDACGWRLGGRTQQARAKGSTGDEESTPIKRCTLV